MNAKNIIRIVLLSVVAAAVGAWAVKEFGPNKSASAAQASLAGQSAVSSEKIVSPPAEQAAGRQGIRPDGVTVINFHGEKRCRTCVGIGTLAKKTLDDEFAAEELAGTVHWEHINIDEPANAHFVKDYALVSSVVLVTLWKDGKEVRWNRLDRVWDHYGDDVKFRTYVAEAVRELLK